MIYFLGSPLKKYTDIKMLIIPTMKTACFAICLSPTRAALINCANICPVHLSVHCVIRCPVESKIGVAYWVVIATFDHEHDELFSVGERSDSYLLSYPTHHLWPVQPCLHTFTICVKPWTQGWGPPKWNISWSAQTLGLKCRQRGTDLLLMPFEFVSQKRTD